MPGLVMRDETTSVSLVTASTSASAQYRLLELTPDLVKQFESDELVGETSRTVLKRFREERDEDLAEQSSNRVCIKGRHDDEAVLCTANQTFALREMTQSNSLLLCTIQQSHSDDETNSRDNRIRAVVKSNVAEIWELTPVVPRTSTLPHLLRDTLYFGEDDDDNLIKSEKRRYTPQNIASIVQASPLELRQGIEEHHIILLDGFYRMVAPPYLSEMLQQLLSYADANAYTYDAIPFHSTLQTLQEHHRFRKEVVEAILLRWYGNLKKGSSDIDGQIELRIVDVVRYIGLESLRMSASKSPIKMDVFTNDWESKVGPLLHDKIDINLLKGHHLIYPPPPMPISDSNPLMIEYFAATSLSLDPAARMQQLFQKREQWTLEDLSPFLNDVAVDAKKRDAILLKHARTNSVKVAIIGDKKERKARLKQGSLQEPTRNIVMYSSRLRYN